MNARLKKRMRSLLFEGEVLRLMSLAVLTKPIGLISQVLMAKYFGAGYRYDAYILALFLVGFFTNTLARVFTAVAIPYIAERKQRTDRDDMNAFVNGLVVLCLLPHIVFSLILAFKGNWLVAIAAPNAPAETKDLAISMLRLMAIPSLLATLIETLKSILNANRAFRVPAIAPIINSAVMLAVLLITHESLGIWALPTAFIVSGVLRATTLLVYSGAKGILTWQRPRVGRDELRLLWDRGWMVLVATVFLIINTFMDKVFASGLVAGSISAVAYANTLLNFGTQIFAFSLVTVMFTKMSDYIARNDMDSLNRYLDVNLKRTVRIAVPVCVAVGVASHELVAVLFQRDAFSLEDTSRTAGALAMYMIGLPAVLLNFVVARVFHAMKRLRDKVWLAAQYLATNVVGNMLLVEPLQVKGLAISSTLAISLHLALSAYMLSRYRVGIAVGSISRGVAVHYALGLTTWLVFRFGGIDGLTAGLGGGSLAGNILTGTVRGTAILVIFAILLLGHNRWRCIRREARTGREG